MRYFLQLSYLGKAYNGWQIQPNGDAILRARGRTGNPDYAVRKPASGSPYAYTIKAHFEENAGTGSRLETRVCEFAFARFSST